MHPGSVVTPILSTADVAVYGLVDPRTDQVRYVGKAADPEARLRQHLRPSSLKLKSKKNSWLKAVIAAGLEPQLVIIDRVPEDQADDAERIHIWTYRELGYDLTNGTDGGDGFRGTHSEETKAKMSATHMGRPKSPEHAAAIAAGRRGLKISDEGRRKISERMKGEVPECLRKAVAAGKLPVGEAHPGATLTEVQVREMRVLHSEGVAGAELARRFGTTPQTVSSIVRRLTWRHVT